MLRETTNTFSYYQKRFHITDATEEQFWRSENNIESLRQFRFSERIFRHFVRIFPELNSLNFVPYKTFSKRSWFNYEPSKAKNLTFFE